MTQEEELRWIDLSGRLPYNPICGTKSSNYKPTYRAGINGYTRTYFFYDDLKVFLRPMSSMTQIEIDDYDEALEADLNIVMDAALDNDRLTTSNGHTFSRKFVSHVAIDWLNAHHFDYRGLIEKGLALEAPEGMYD